VKSEPIPREDDPGNWIPKKPKVLKTTKTLKKSKVEVPVKRGRPSKKK
jgi:hypothetical protein